MAENENDPQESAPEASAERPTVKKVMVKRIKVPVSHAAAPAPSSAPAPEAANEALPAAETPDERSVPEEAEELAGGDAAVEEAAVEEVAEEEALEEVAPEEESAEEESAPEEAASETAESGDAVEETSEESEASSSEPELPPEDKSAIVPSPVEAEEIEKDPPRKRRRRAYQAPAEPDPRAEKIKEIKDKANEIIRTRAFKIGTAAFIGLILLYCFYLWLPSLAESKIPELFKDNGIPMASFRVKSVTTEAMELTGVRDASGTVNISNIKASYSLTDLLMSKRIKSLTVSGITVTGEKTNEGISLGALGGAITSTMRKSEDNAMTIDKLNLSGNFILHEEEPPAPPQPAAPPAKGKKGEEPPPEEEPEGPFTVKFSANGSWKPTGLRLNVTTNVENKQLVLSASSSFFKSPASTEIKAEVTEGNVLENEQTVGSVTGTFEAAVQNGALTKGVADMVVTTPVQDLQLKGNVTPGEKEGFNLDVRLNRSFKKPQDAFGKFTGDLTLKADGLKMSGNLQKFEGALPLALESASLSNGKISLTNMKMTADVNVSCDTGVCNYSLTKPLKADIASFAYAGQFMQLKTYEPLALGLNPAKEPFLTSKKGMLSFRLPLVGFAAKTLVSDKSGSLQTVAAVNGARAVVNFNPFAGTYAGRMVFSQSGYADRNVKLTNLQGDLSFDNKNLPALNLRVGSAVLVRQGILPPMTADLKLKPMRGVEYGVDLSVKTQNGLVSATAQGSYSLPSKEWVLLVDVPEQKFSDGGLKLSDILPSVAAKFKKEPTGGLALKGRLNIRDGKIGGPLSLLIRDVSARWGEIDVANANGVLEINSLKPFETAMNQQLFIGSLNTGVPFKNALLNFSVSQTTGVKVDSLKMSYADGQFQNLKSFTVPFEGAPSAIYLEGKGINLDVLSRNLKDSYLKAEGIIDSDWKLSLKNGAVVVDNARFQSKIPGLLEFDAPDSVKQKMNKDMQAFLKNVIVKDLLFAMKGPMNGLMDFKLGIQGHSPLDTTQTNKEMSLNFSGALTEFFKQDAGAFEIPSDIRLSLENFYK